VSLPNIIYQQALADPIAIAMAKSPTVDEGIVLKDLPDADFPTVNSFTPLNDGTAREEDTMNHVRSVYSSLMPKENNVVVVRADTLDPAIPDTAKQTSELSFAPKNPNSHPYTHKTVAQENLNLPPLELLSAETMESPSVAKPNNADDGSVTNEAQRVQTNAMLWSQYISPSINSPPLQPIIDMIRDPAADVTGHQEVVEDQLAARRDEGVVEGWKIPDVTAEVAQTVLKANSGIVMPSELVDPQDPATPAAEVAVEPRTSIDSPAQITIIPVISDMSSPVGEYVPSHQVVA